MPRTGTQWLLLPHEYPPRGAVFYHYAQWRENGTWEQVTRVLRESSRHTIGRRLAKGYERFVETGEMLLYLAMSRILLRRLTSKRERQLLTSR